MRTTRQPWIFYTYNLNTKRPPSAIESSLDEGDDDYSKPELKGRKETFKSAGRR